MNTETSEEELDEASYGTTTNILIGRGTVVHLGNRFGSPCGAAFNRRGGTPQITYTTEPVTCRKCLNS